MLYRCSQENLTMLISSLAAFTLTLLLAVFLARVVRSTPRPQAIPVRCCEYCENQKQEVERPYL